MAKRQAIKRDKRGRFVKGSQARKGITGPQKNPRTRTKLAAKGYLTETWTTEQIARLGHKLLLDALGELNEPFNIESARLVLDHAVGRPTPAPDEMMMVSHDELVGIFEELIVLLERIIPEQERRKQVAEGIWDILRAAGIRS